MSTMRFDIITIFPKVFEGYFSESMFKRVKAKKLLDIRVHDLRDYVAPRRARGNLAKRRQVDDRPFGGGPGMVIKIEPLARALEKILGKKVTSPPKPPPLTKGRGKGGGVNTLVVLLSASGKQFNSETAANFAKKYDRVIFIAGHYEGIDERIKKMLHASGFKFQEISIGPYVLTGGELPAMVMADSIARHIPGFLGKAESLEEKRLGVGVPVYTRPETFTFKGKKYKVPKVLLSGNHKKVDDWRHAKRAKSLD